MSNFGFADRIFPPVTEARHSFFTLFNEIMVSFLKADSPVFRKHPFSAGLKDYSEALPHQSGCTRICILSPGLLDSSFFNIPVKPSGSLHLPPDSEK